jgi:hypothetical protein
LTPLSALFLAARLRRAFSVSPSQLEAVLQYVEARNKSTIRTRTFQEEYRGLLRKHGVDFDRLMSGIEKTPDSN